MNSVQTGRVHRGVRLLRVLSLFVVFLIGGVALAAPALSPTDTIRKANDRLKELLGGKVTAAEQPRVAQQVTSELRSLFDIEDLARRAMGSSWARMTPAQQKELVGTLRELIERNYLAQLRGNLDYETEYAGEEKRGDDVLVRTVIKGTRKGRPVAIRVDYLLKAAGNHWTAYDVVTDDVSLLDNYRGQFSRIVKKDGVDGLIARMKKKLQKSG